MIVLQISVAMFLTILSGWGARRLRLVTADATAGMSRLLVDVTFPALVFVQLLRTVSESTMAARWYVPVLGAAVIVVSAVVGAVAAALARVRRARRTFVFLVTVPNWIFLPLPIAQALYGAEGLQIVLLINAGAQVALWTLGVWILRGGRLDVDTWRGLLLNPGLVATVASIVLAVWAPPPRAWLEAAPLVTARPAMAGWAALRALDLLGSLTIPLSLVVTGAQLAAPEVRGRGGRGALGGVTALRLAVVPAVFAALLLGVERLGLVVGRVPQAVILLVAAMPCAVSCGPFAERYGGDVPLAAQAVFVTTLVGLATVPLVAVLLGVG